MSDILDSVIQQFRDREALGLVKYGTTVDRDDLTVFQWIKHHQYELMDAILYDERLIRAIREREEMAYKLGWIACSQWADRDDLVADTDSGAYTGERDAALARIDQAIADERAYWRGELCEAKDV